MMKMQQWNTKAPLRPIGSRESGGQSTVCPIMASGPQRRFLCAFPSLWLAGNRRSDTLACRKSPVGGK